MERKGIKTTTYSLDWDTVMNLESRLLRDFQTNKTKDKARALLMVSIGVRLGMRVIDNLNLKWEDLLGVQVGERFIRIEKKTDKELYQPPINWTNSEKQFDCFVSNQSQR